MLIRFLAPVTALACTSLCIALWLAGFSRLVLRVMHLVASSYSQFDQPYADTYSLLAVMQCYRQGVDIYVANPCDLYNRPNNYSAVWLLGARTPVTTASTLLAGSALAVAFCLSLFLLPPARTRFGAVALTAGVVSNAAIFACYQGNADVVIFVLAALAGRGLLGGLGARVAGYALLLAAGSLKFYPVALMVLALRERVQVLLAVAACACVAVAAFVWVDGADAVRAMHAIPGGKITQMFGASVIGRGLAVVPGGLRASVATPPWVWYGAVVEAACCAAAAAGAWRLFQHRGLRGAITALPAPEKIFAAIGCVLILACFFSGQSYRYRGIFLLFVLPAAVTLCAAAGDRIVRRGAAALALAIVALMWSVHIGNGLDHAMTVAGVPDRIGDLVYAAWWLAREMLWWAVITVLLGLLGGLAAEWHGISAVLAGRPRRAPAGRAPPAAAQGPQPKW